METKRRKIPRIGIRWSRDMFEYANFRFGYRLRTSNFFPSSTIGSHSGSLEKTGTNFTANYPMKTRREGDPISSGIQCIFEEFQALKARDKFQELKARDRLATTAKKCRERAADPRVNKGKKLGRVKGTNKPDESYQVNSDSPKRLTYHLWDLGVDGSSLLLPITPKMSVEKQMTEQNLRDNFNIVKDMSDVMFTSEFQEKEPLQFNENFDGDFFPLRHVGMGELNPSYSLPKLLINGPESSSINDEDDVISISSASTEIFVPDDDLMDITDGITKEGIQDIVSFENTNGSFSPSICEGESILHKDSLTQKQLKTPESLAISTTSKVFPSLKSLTINSIPIMVDSLKSENIAKVETLVKIDDIEMNFHPGRIEELFENIIFRSKITKKVYEDIVLKENRFFIYHPTEGQNHQTNLPLLKTSTLLQLPSHTSSSETQSFQQEGSLDQQFNHATKTYTTERLYVESESNSTTSRVLVTEVPEISNKFCPTKKEECLQVSTSFLTWLGIYAMEICMQVKISKLDLCQLSKISQIQSTISVQRTTGEGETYFIGGQTFSLISMDIDLMNFLKKLSVSTIEVDKLESIAMLFYPYKNCTMPTEESETSWIINHYVDCQELRFNALANSRDPLNESHQNAFECPSFSRIFKSCCSNRIKFLELEAIQKLNCNHELENWNKANHDDDYLSYENRANSLQDGPQIFLEHVDSQLTNLNATDQSETVAEREVDPPAVEVNEVILERDTIQVDDLPNDHLEVDDLPNDYLDETDRYDHEKVRDCEMQECSSHLTGEHETKAINLDEVVEYLKQSCNLPIWIRRYLDIPEEILNESKIMHKRRIDCLINERKLLESDNDFPGKSLSKYMSSNSKEKELQETNVNVLIDNFSLVKNEDIPVEIPTCDSNKHNTEEATMNNTACDSTVLNEARNSSHDKCKQNFDLKCFMQNIERKISELVWKPSVLQETAKESKFPEDSNPFPEKELNISNSGHSNLQDQQVFASTDKIDKMCHLLQESKEKDRSREMIVDRIDRAKIQEKITLLSQLSDGATNTCVSEKQKQITLASEREVPLTGKSLHLYRRIEYYGKWVLDALKDGTCADEADILFLRDHQTLSTLTPHVMQSILSHLDKKIPSDVRLKQQYRLALLLDILSKALDLLLHCSFRSAICCLEEYQDSAIYCDIFKEILLSVSRSTEDLHPKTHIIKELYYSMPNSKTYGVKMLVIVRREGNAVVKELQIALPKERIALFSNETNFNYLQMMKLMEQTSILICSFGDLELPEGLPWTWFSLVVEWEQNPNCSIQRREYSSRHNIKSLTLLSKVPQDKGTRGEETPASPHSSQVLERKELEEQNETFVFMASERVINDSELHYVLTSKYDIELVERRFRYAFGGNVMKALTRLVVMCLQFKDDFTVVPIYAYNYDQVGLVVRTIGDTCRTHSGVWTKDEWTRRTWLNTTMTLDERFLLGYPCINPLSAQAFYGLVHVNDQGRKESCGGGHFQRPVTGDKEDMAPHFQRPVTGHKEDMTPHFQRLVTGHKEDMTPHFQRPVTGYKEDMTPHFQHPVTGYKEDMTPHFQRPVTGHKEDMTPHFQRPVTGHKEDMTPHFQRPVTGYKEDMIPHLSHCFGDNKVAQIRSLSASNIQKVEHKQFQQSDIFSNVDTITNETEALKLGNNSIPSSSQNNFLNESCHRRKMMSPRASHCMIERSTQELCNNYDGNYSRNVIKNTPLNSMSGRTLNNRLTIDRHLQSHKQYDGSSSSFGRTKKSALDQRNQQVQKVLPSQRITLGRESQLQDASLKVPPSPRVTWSRESKIPDFQALRQKKIQRVLPSPRVTLLRESKPFKKLVLHKTKGTGGQTKLAFEPM